MMIYFNVATAAAFQVVVVFFPPWLKPSSPKMKWVHDAAVCLGGLLHIYHPS